jgi:hypothetical protein
VVVLARGRRRYTGPYFEGTIVQCRKSTAYVTRLKGGAMAYLMSVVFVEGARAFTMGTPRSANPHHNFGDAWRAWDGGWLDAQKAAGKGEVLNPGR